MITMKRFLIGSAAALALCAASAFPVAAAQPVVKGCVGASISAFVRDPAARQLSDSFANTLAHNDFGPGVSAEVQLGQAGLMPDSVFPNSCN